MANLRIQSIQVVIFFILLVYFIPVFVGVAFQVNFIFLLFGQRIVHPAVIEQV